MILRVIRGRADSRQLEGLAASLQRALPSGTGGEADLSRLHLGRRTPTRHPDNGPGDEVVVIAFWRSAEAAAAADQRGASPLAMARAALQDLSVEHYELSETVLRELGHPPRLLRIATGQFSKPGADKEMLDLLRERAPGIGPPMVEAYVGRRMLGREVCVTFVSTWHEAPPGQKLEDAFWRDIALRYDSFDVGVYDCVPLTKPADPQERAPQ